MDSRLFTPEDPPHPSSAGDDTFTIDIEEPSGATVLIADGSIYDDITEFTRIPRFRLPDGTPAGWQTGWKEAKVNLPASEITGTNTLELVVADQGDAAVNSILLIDKIEVS